MKRLLRRLPFYRHIFFAKKRRQYFRWDEQDESMLEFYRQFIVAGDILFDVGANFGNRTKIFLALRASVIAFEPQSQCADFLRSTLNNVQGFTLVEKALGAKVGTGEMLVCDAHTLSTLSEEWVDITKKSGRFDEYDWKDKQPVKITTLDKAIDQFGTPKFIKIDVEGFERNVLSGLSRPVEYISIEFAAENISNTEKCIDYIESLSEHVAFQLSLGESMKFELREWVSPREIKEVLSNVITKDRMAWGDIYIRTQLMAI